MLKKIVILKLTWLSKMIVRKYKPFVVAVTGSVGKTSAKDAIYCVLKDQAKYVRKSEKSLNSDIGLPLTILGVPNAWHDMYAWFANIWKGVKLVLKKSDYPDILVLEIGADHPNDIKSVMKWLHPDIAVITKVSQTPVHVEFFDSPQQVFEEKASLAMGVKKGGTVILFGDDDNVLSIKDMVKDVNIITYGLNEKADVRGNNYRVLEVQNHGNSEDAPPVNAIGGMGLQNANLRGNSAPQGISFDITIGGTTSNVSVKKIISSTFMYPLLSAAAVGKAKGMNVEDIAKHLNTYEAPKGRMNLIEGMNSSTLIDDTYNSSPDAAVSALKTLEEFKGKGRLIAILGDMMELGKYSADEHRKIGKVVSGVVNELITVGPRSRFTAEEAEKQGLSADHIHIFDSSNAAAEFMAKNVQSGDIILIKGSQSVRMERVTKALLAKPEQAPELLVRQEKEWERR